MAQEVQQTGEVRTKVNQLSAFAKDTKERLATKFFNTIRGANKPADIYNATRYDNLGFLKKFLKRNEEDPTVQKATNTLQELRLRNEPPGNLRVGDEPLEPVNPALFDRLETLDLSLRALLTIEDVDKRDELAREIRQRTDQSTQEMIAEIDSGERVIDDVIIVGGGLLTSVAATTLAYAGVKFSIISESELGEPWLNQPIFINSATRARFGGVDLPLLEGSTTPITPSFQNNAIGADALLDLPGEVLRIQCDDSQVPTREYIAGPGLGLLTALDELAGTIRVMTNQYVDATKLTVNADRTKTLTITDKKTGITRTKDGKFVLFLTGPGPERFGIQDPATKEAYDTGAAKFQADIVNGQQQIDALNVRINELGEGDEREQLEEQRDAITVELPRILSFTLFKEAYRFWVFNGRRNPSPILPLLGLNKPEPIEHAIGGGGDTSFVEAETVKAKGPASSLPQGLNREEVNTDVTIYNLPEKKPRTRYRETVESVNSIPGVKVVSATISDERVLVTDTRGKTTAFDYFWVSTGLEPSPIPAQIRAALEQQGLAFGDVLDDVERGQRAQRVALGNADLGVVVAGSTTNLKAKDFPQQIADLIETLGIRENTISVWVNSLLVQRCLLSLGIQGKLPIEQTTEKLYAGVPTRPLRPDEPALLNALRAISPEKVEESQSSILAETGPYTGILNNARPYNSYQLVRIAQDIRSIATKQDPQFFIRVLETVGNRLADVRRLNEFFLSVGAQRALVTDAGAFSFRRVEQELVGRFNYTQEQFIDVLYGYYGAALGVGSPAFIDALNRIAELQNRAVREVIEEQLPIISTVRLERPDLNTPGGTFRGDGRPVRYIDDEMREKGFFWNPKRNTYEYVDIRQYPSDINDPRVSALVADGQEIIKNIYIDGISSFRSENTREVRDIVLPYLKAIGEKVVIDAIRNPDLLLDEITKRRFEGLVSRINSGAQEARTSRIEDIDQKFRGRYRFSNERFTDVMYGYFALLLVTGNPPRALDIRYPQFTAIGKIAQLRSEQELRNVSIPEVIEDLLPLFNRARLERPDLQLSKLQNRFSMDDSFPFDAPLRDYGFIWNREKDSYVKRNR